MRQRIAAYLLAITCLLFIAPAAPAWAAADTDGGPGVWGPAASGGARPGSLPWHYEGQINGRGADWNYWVPFPETRNRPGFDINTWEPWKLPANQRDGAPFDGWNRSEGQLLDAKGQSYARLLDPKNAHWSQARKGLEDEVGRQLRAARGTPVTWHWAEEGAHEQMDDFLDRNGIKSQVTQPRDPATFAAPGSPNDPDGMARPRGAAVRPPAGAPGGIDFSKLQLRNVSTGTVGPHGTSYSFKTPSPAIGDADLNAARDSSNAFFVWLELQPSQFWVNLNPSQPDKIIDPDLARTDVGKVLLESDLQLKKTMTPLTGPGTPTGDEFVRKVFAGPDKDTCMSFRTWIEPAPATVRETDSELYILDAPLDVKSETLYFTDPKTGKRSCPGQTEERARYNESVVRTVVLPQVVKAVNEAPEYADLRRVYMSRVAAEWYRQVSTTKDTFFKPLIGDGIVGPYVSAKPWDPKTVFNEYLKLYNGSSGTIDIGGVTYNWIFGGVDMSKAPSAPMNAGDFAAKYPRLPQVVQRSIDQPTKDQDGKTLWAGGTTVLDEQAPSPSQSSSPPPSLPVTGASGLLWLAGAVLCVVGVLLLALFRQRRRQFVS